MLPLPSVLRDILFNKKIFCFWSALVYSSRFRIYQVVATSSFHICVDQHLTKFLPFLFQGLSTNNFCHYSYSNHSNLKMEAECPTKTLSYLNLISPEPKMVDTSCKKYQNKEELQNILNVFILLRKLKKTRSVPSKIGNFQYLPLFRSICEAPWMQIFVFLQLI